MAKRKGTGGTGGTGGKGGKGGGRQFDWNAFRRGQSRKRAGIDRVAANAGTWTPDAHKVVLRLCELTSGVEMLGEDISAIVLQELGAPHHHNALSALGNWYVGQGLVIRLGWQPMRKPTSNARLTPLYRLVHPRDAVPVPRKGKRGNGHDPEEVG